MDLRALIISVVLGGLFGAATATVDSIDSEMMVVDIVVEVTATGGTVVAHLSFQEDPVLTLPLLDRGDGTFGIRTELEPKNYVVTFEAIGEESGSSDPVTLTQMGADLGPHSGDDGGSGSDDDDMSPESRRALWLAIALGAAALSALAFWVLGGRNDEAQLTDVTGTDEEE